MLPRFELNDDLATLIGRICTRFAGILLAIELAGGPLEALHASCVVAAPPAGEQEQRLMVLLASSERTCGQGLSIAVFDGLASLVEKQQKKLPGGELCCIMLEMIRLDAGEQLLASGEAEELHRRRLLPWPNALKQGCARRPVIAGCGNSSWNWNGSTTRWGALRGGEVLPGVQLMGTPGLFWYGNGYDGRRGSSCSWMVCRRP